MRHLWAWIFAATTTASTTTATTLGIMIFFMITSIFCSEWWACLSVWNKKTPQRRGVDTVHIMRARHPAAAPHFLHIAYLLIRIAIVVSRYLICRICLNPAKDWIINPSVTGRFGRAAIVLATASVALPTTGCRTAGRGWRGRFGGGCLQRRIGHGLTGGHAGAAGRDALRWNTYRWSTFRR